MLYSKIVSQLVSIMLLAAVPAVGGTIVFSNLTQPGDLYGPDGISFGANPYIPDPGSGIVVTRFYVTMNGPVDYIQAPLDIISGPTDLFGYLLTDNSGLPGDIVEIIHLVSISSGPSVPLSVIPSALHPILSTGTPYWFGVSAGTNTFASWLFTPFLGVPLGSSNFAVGALRDGTPSGWILGTGGPTGREGAFQVVADVTSIPESRSVILVAAGLLLLWAGVELRKRIVR